MTKSHHHVSFICFYCKLLSENIIKERCSRKFSPSLSPSDSIWNMRHLWNETILPSVYFYITFIQKLICNKKVFRTKIVLLTHYLLTRSYLYQKDSILNLNWLRAWRNKGQSHYKLIKSFMCNESLSELRPSSVIERCYNIRITGQ